MEWQRLTFLYSVECEEINVVGALPCGESEGTGECAKHGHKAIRDIYLHEICLHFYPKETSNDGIPMLNFSVIYFAIDTLISDILQANLTVFL